MRLLHVVAFSKKLRWLAQVKKLKAAMQIFRYISECRMVSKVHRETAKSLERKNVQRIYL